MSIRRNISILTIASTIAIGTITHYEGFRSDAYLDVVGVPTIGYGSTKDVKLGDRIDEKGARSRLIKEVIDTYGQAVKNCVKVPLHQSEYDSFVSLTYNIGPTAFCKSTLVKKVNKEDYIGACKEILRWRKAEGKVLKGLIKRREAEYQLCISEHDGEDKS